MGILTIIESRKTQTVPPTRAIIEYPSADAATKKSIATQSEIPV
jgi:hypothetical protein